MKKIYLIAFISIVSFAKGIAQNGTIEGEIRLANSAIPLQRINVYLENTTIGAVTDDNGTFIMNNIPQGNYVLTVSDSKYAVLKNDLTITENKVTKVNLQLKELGRYLPVFNIITDKNNDVRDIPGSVNYISPRELQRFSYTDINRTLRSIPGTNMQEEDGFGLRPNIGLRGTGVERSSKITVMEDGVLMAPAPYAAPAAYYFPTVGRMQGIEILKGSSQIKFGPYTTGGAINLISTQIPDDFSGRINLTGGSFGGRNLHAFVGNSHKNIGYLVETFQYGSNGFKQLDGGGKTGFDKQDYLAKVRINTGEKAKVNQSLSFKIGQAQETSDQTYLGLTQDDFSANPYRQYAGSQKDQMTTSQSQLSLTHSAQFSIFTIATTVYRSDFTRNWYKLDKIIDSTGSKTSINSLLEDPNGFNDAYSIITGHSSTTDDALQVKANNRSYFAQGLQTVVGLDWSDFFSDDEQIKHHLDIGVRYHQDQIDRFQWVDQYAMDNGVMELTTAGIHGSESNRIETANALASYLQYQLKIKRFTLSPGIRYENITLERQDYGKDDSDRSGSDLTVRSNTVDVFIPGIGATYRLNKPLVKHSYVNLFGGVHKGFSPPGSKEGTEPEESVNYELGVRFRKLFSSNGLITGQVVGFLNDYSNLLGADLNAAGGGGTNDLFNGGEVQTIGLEFQTTYSLLSFKNSDFSNLPISLSYTFTNAIFQNDFSSDFEGWGEVSAGDQFPYMAKHQLSIGLGLVHEKFGVNVSGKYMDAMRTTPGQGTILNYEKTDAYFIIDASANYALHKSILLFASATNITDQVYVVARRPAGLRPGMPRAFTVGLKANF